MSKSTPTFAESIGNLANGIASAFQPIAEAYQEFANGVLESFREAFAPMLARKRPYETGKELAEVVVDHRLTAAERYPVRATTTYHDDSIVVEYDDGTGFEAFQTYSKDAIAGDTDE